jgi:hypothetical protein
MVPGRACRSRPPPVVILAVFLSGKDAVAFVGIEFAPYTRRDVSKGESPTDTRMSRRVGWTMATTIPRLFVGHRIRCRSEGQEGFASHVVSKRPDLYWMILPRWSDSLYGVDV